MSRHAFIYGHKSAYDHDQSNQPLSGKIRSEPQDRGLANEKIRHCFTTFSGGPVDFKEST